jgi:hypothetical protein
MGPRQAMALALLQACLQSTAPSLLASFRALPHLLWAPGPQLLELTHNLELLAIAAGRESGGRGQGGEPLLKKPANTATHFMICFKCGGPFLLALSLPTKPS